MVFAAKPELGPIERERAGGCGGEAESDDDKGAGSLQVTVTGVSGCP